MGRGPAPLCSPLPAGLQAGLGVCLGQHVRGKWAGGGTWLRRPSSTRPAPARGSGGILPCVSQSESQSQTLGGRGPGEGAEVVAAGTGEPNSHRQCWPQWAGRARRLRGPGDGGGGDTGQSDQRSSGLVGGAERSETCASVQPSSPLAALHPCPITVGPAPAKPRPTPSSPTPGYYGPRPSALRTLGALAEAGKGGAAGRFPLRAPPAEPQQGGFAE